METMPQSLNMPVNPRLIHNTLPHNHLLTTPMGVCVLINVNVNVCRSLVGCEMHQVISELIVYLGVRFLNNE